MDLLQGEEMIWAGHPTWRSMLAFHIKGFAITAVVVGVLVLLNAIGVGIGVAAIVIVAIVGVAITILTAWIRRYFTQYSITTKRLQISRGVLSKTESSTNVDRVQNITITQALIERILRCGTLDFDTAGEDQGDFSFAGVNDPQGLRDRIMRARNEQSSGAADDDRDDQGGLA